MKPVALVMKTFMGTYSFISGAQVLDATIPMGVGLTPLPGQYTQYAVGPTYQSHTRSFAVDQKNE